MATDRNDDKERDVETSAPEKLDDLYKLIDDIEIAMFTTRRPDGHLVSRPMATQERKSMCDVWFVADIESNKFDELARDPHVNLGYYNIKSREYVSMAGTAVISQDRNLIRGLYKPDWKAWFGDKGGSRDGGPEDPRLALILVTAHSAEYLVTNTPKAVMMFQVAKAMITGNPPDVGDQRTVNEAELHQR